MEFFKEAINIGEVLVQLAAFMIVFLTLKKFAWKPLLGSLQAREDRIKAEFDKIEMAAKDVEALKREYAAKMQKIEDDARAKIQEAVEDGRRVAKEIQEKARAEAQASFEKSKENLEMEIAKARVELRRDIAALAVSTSERILNEKMSNDQAQQAKILDIINDLEKVL
jgi:F-type H+-transporting ATPase subunit b